MVCLAFGYAAGDFCRFLGQFADFETKIPTFLIRFFIVLDQNHFKQVIL